MRFGFVLRERERERESAIWVCFAIFGFCGIAMEKSRFSVFLWGCVGEE